MSMRGKQIPDTLRRRHCGVISASPCGRFQPFPTAKGSTAPDGITVLGIPVANMTMTDALEAILAHLNHDGTHQVCFVNPHCANIAWRHIAYRRVLCHATLTLADGIRMKLAGKFLGQGFKQNVNGTDLFPRLARDYPVPIEEFSSLQANRARRKAY